MDARQFNEHWYTMAGSVSCWEWQECDEAFPKHQDTTGFGATQENNHISQAATLGAGGLYYNVHKRYTSHYAAMQKAPCSV